MIGPIPSNFMTEEFIKQNGRKFTGTNNGSGEEAGYLIDDYYYLISQSCISAGPLWDFAQVTFEDSGETVYPYDTEDEGGMPVLGLRGRTNR